MKVRTIVFAAVLAVSAGAALAGPVRPDQIPELQKEGKVASFDRLNQAALAGHPGGVVGGTWLTVKNDRYTYEVGLTDNAGQRWKVKLDAGSAQLISVKRKGKPSPASAAAPAQ